MKNQSKPILKTARISIITRIPIFVRLSPLHKTVTLNVNTESTLSSIKAALTHYLTPDTLESARLSLQGKFLSSHTPLKLCPLSTLTLDTPKLIGGMLHDRDDDFIRAPEDAEPIDTTSTDFSEPHSFVNRLSQSTVQLAKSQSELNAQLTKRFSERVLPDWLERSFIMPYDEIEELTESLKEHQEWFILLSESEQRVVAGIFVEVFHQNPQAKQWFSIKVAVMLDRLNHDRQSTIRTHLGFKNFVFRFLAQSQCMDRIFFYKIAQDLYGEAKWSDTFASDHISHPQGSHPEPIHIKPGLACLLMTLQNSKQEDLEGFLGERLPPGSANEVEPLVRIFYSPISVMRLLIVLGPKRYAEVFDREDSPSWQKLCLDLVMNAREECFLELIMKAFREEKPTNEEQILQALAKQFRNATLAQKSVMLDWTSSCQVLALWLRGMSAYIVYDLVKKKSLDFTIQTLNLCSIKVSKQVQEKLPRDVQQKIQNARLLQLIGYPRKSFQELETEVQNLKQTVPLSTRKFVQAVARPSQPDCFVCVETQQSALYYDQSECNQKSKAETAVIRVKTQPYLRQEDVAAKFTEFGLPDAEVKALTKAVQPDDEYQQEMRMTLAPKREQQPDFSFRISFWKLSTECSSVSYDSCFDAGELQEFRQMGEQVTNSSKRIFIYEGRTGELFWFTKSKECLFTLHILDPESQTPSAHEIPSDTKLHAYLDKGNADIGEGAQEDKSLPNSLPELIRDTPETPMIVFRYLSYDEGWPAVVFYDLEERREICQARSVQMFVNYVPTGDLDGGRVYFLRKPELAREFKSYEDVDYAVSGCAFQIVVVQRTGLPSFYSCSVDFADARLQDEMVELIDDLVEPLRMMKELYQSNESEIEAFCKERQTWAYCTNENHFAFTKMFQNGAVIVRAYPSESSEALFDFSVTAYEPTEQPNHNWFYQMRTDGSVKLLFTSQQLWCTRVTSTTFPASKILKIEPTKDRLSAAPIDDAYNDEYSVDWPQAEHAGRRRWYSETVIVGKSLVRCQLDQAGSITWSRADMPSKGQEVLNFTNFTIDHSTLPTTTDYPLLCNWHPWHQLMVTQLTDLSQGPQVFEFDDVEFVCFVEDMGCSSESRITFIARDKRTQGAVLVLMRHENSFQAAKTRDLNKWSIQRFSLDKAFKVLFKEASSIRKAFLLYDQEEIGLRTEHCQPSIIYTTRTAICQVTKDTHETLLHNNSIVELTQVDLVRGFNNYFYFVQRDLATQTDNVIELNLAEGINKYKAIQRVIYRSSTGRIFAMNLDTNTSTVTDSYWSFGGQKKLFRPYVMNQLFILDDQANLTAIRQDDSMQYYEVVMKKDVSNCPDLVRQLETQAGYQSMAISERSCVLEGTIYVYETGKCFNAFHGELDQWYVLGNPCLPTTDKLLYSMVHSQTGQCQYVIKTDPCSRNTSLLGCKNRRDILQLSFVAADLVLIQMRTNKSLATKAGTYWTLIDIHGQVHPLSYGLNRLTERNRDANLCSGLTKRGQYQLVFTKKDKVSVATLSLKGVLTAYECFSTRTSDAHTEETLFDFNGECYLVTIQGQQSGAEEPQVLSKQVGKESSLSHISFPCGQKGTMFQIVGEYLTWREPESLKIGVLDLRQIQNATADSAQQCELNVRWIDLAEVQGYEKVFLISLDPCSLNYALHASPSQKLTFDFFRRQSNHLQVSIGNRGLIFDLNQTEMPIVRELVALDKLMDCQKYVEAGFQATYLSTNQGLVSQENYGLEQAIEASTMSGFYIMRQEQIPTKAALEHKDHLEDERVAIFKGLYRTFSELSLLETRRLLDLAELGITPKFVENAALFASFEGMTFFALTLGKLKVHKATYESLSQANLEPEEDFDEQEVENSILRRLKYILMQKSFVSESPKDGSLTAESCLTRTLTQPAARDQLLQIGSLSEGFNILDDFVDTDQFETILQYGTTISTNELNRCFRLEKTSNELNDLPWPMDLEAVTYTSDSCLFKRKDLLKKLALDEIDEESSLLRTVTPRMLNISWMFKKKSFLRLQPALTGQVQNFYATEFIQRIFQEFWVENQRQIFWLQFIPYMTYILVSFFFMIMVYSPIEPGQEPSILKIRIVGSINAALWLYETLHEVKQFYYQEQKLAHFKSFWNLMDMVGLILMMLIISHGLLDSEYTFLELETLRIQCAFASFCLLIKAFDWLRLFEETAFYILLVEETLNDITAFMVLFSASLLAFGMPMLYLNFNRNEDTQVMSTIFNIWFLDVLLNQYELALGEFNLENFDGNGSGIMCYIFFIMATFITQLTMLNMLIAIMGDTFSRVMESREVSATQTKIELMSDLSTIMPKRTSKTEQHAFLFVVSPTDEREDKDNAWESSIMRLKHANEKLVGQLEDRVNKKFAMLMEQQRAAAKSSVQQSADIKKQVFSMVKNQVQGLKQALLEKKNQ